MKVTVRSRCADNCPSREMEARLPEWDQPAAACSRAFISSFFNRNRCRLSACANSNRHHEFVLDDVLLQRLKGGELMAVPKLFGVEEMRPEVHRLGYFFCSVGAGKNGDDQFGQRIGPQPFKDL